MYAINASGINRKAVNKNEIGRQNMSTLMCRREDYAVLGGCQILDR